MSITIKDIAKAADVSHTTVSRALRGHPAISTETVARIQKLADDMGYVPSAAARLLKTRRSQVLGVLVQRVADPFFAEVLDGIQDVLQDRAYNLFLASPGKDRDYEDAAIQAMIEHRIEGIIICSTYVSADSYERLAAAQIPVVVAHNHGLEETKHALYHDDFTGGQEMAAHLLALGHRHIAFIEHQAGGRVSRERRAGYESALFQAGLALRQDCIVDAASDDFTGGYQAGLSLLALPKRPSAIFCYNDLLAIGVMQALQQAGVRVPEDCSVAGFDNIDLSAYVRPSLTTFDQPKYALGVQAAQMLLHLLDADNPDLPTEQIMLRGRVLQRESTAPPRQL